MKRKLCRSVVLEHYALRKSNILKFYFDAAQNFTVLISFFQQLFVRFFNLMKMEVMAATNQTITAANVCFLVITGFV